MLGVVQVIGLGRSEQDLLDPLAAQKPGQPAVPTGPEGNGSAGIFFTSANDSNSPAASSRAAMVSWKGMRISPVGEVGWFKRQTGRGGRTFVVGSSGTRRPGLEVPTVAGSGGKPLRLTP